MKADRDHLEKNLDSVLEVQKREWEQQSPSQRRVTRISRIIGRPMFLAGIIAFTAFWTLTNWILPKLGLNAFDPYPYALLDGVLSLVALGSTTVILIAQSRQTQFEQKQAHIALQVILLSEQKVTKLIVLLEELRRDLPMVRDRFDPQIEALNKHANAAEIHAAIEEAGIGQDIEAEK